MQKLLGIFFLLCANLAVAQREIGPVVVTFDKNTIPVHVSGNTSELNSLALQAFGVHGRYHLVGSGGDFDIKFTQLAPGQVRLDVRSKTNAPMDSQTVSGTDSRNALLRAADIAVTETNGLGLRGFFTAKLAFIRDLGRVKEVCVGDLFFGGVKQITHDGALALMPRWSPDGTRLLYTSYFKSGAPDIFEINLSTYQRTTFVNYNGTNVGAHFNPSGTQVAMVLTGGGNSEIFTTNGQGRQPVRRTHSDYVKASPCYSPDGGRIVFAMESGPQLYVMSASGSTPQRLSTGFSYAAEPDWSRTKTNLIACTVKSGAQYQIAVYDFSKGEATVVSHAPFDGQEPSWLADGRHIVYTARSAGESRICILDSETGKSVPISPASFGSASQASVWTP